LRFRLWKVIAQRSYSASTVRQGALEKQYRLSLLQVFAMRQ
jgi:hypothetical protein